jgi:hypothetical protein
MPDKHDAAGLIAALPSCVELPGDFFDRSGAMGTHWIENRQFPRFYFRTPAAMEIEPSLPTLQRTPRRERVYVKDVSRVGLALLHGEQLYPGERLRLLFEDGIERRSTVSRCRRIQANCYEVAARFDGVEA